MPAATEETPGQKPPITTLVNCPKCGTSNTPDTRYCSSCGASLRGAIAKQPEETAEKKGFISRLFGKRE